MRKSLFILSLLAGILAPAALAKTTMVCFGEDNSYSDHWNHARGSINAGKGGRTTAALKNTAGAASAISITYKTGGVAASNVELSEHRIGEHARNLWFQAHGYQLEDEQLERGWRESFAVPAQGSHVNVGHISIGGLTANNSYTVSSVFNVDNLLHISGWGTESPVSLTGTGLNIKHAYLSGAHGNTIDLLHPGGVDLTALLSGGTFMMTWQFETSAAFTSSVDMQFSDKMRTLGGHYDVSTIAVTEGMPHLIIPEPATASLGLLGVAALLLRRRRS